MQIVARMLSDRTKARVPVNPDHIVVFNGCGTALESLAFETVSLISVLMLLQILLV
jgi:hypothetical protein